MKNLFKHYPLGNSSNGTTNTQLNTARGVEKNARKREEKREKERKRKTERRREKNMSYENTHLRKVSSILTAQRKNHPKEMGRECVEKECDRKKRIGGIRHIKWDCVHVRRVVLMAMWKMMKTISLCNVGSHIHMHSPYTFFLPSLASRFSSTYVASVLPYPSHMYVFEFNVCCSNYHLSVSLWCK